MIGLAGLAGVAATGVAVTRAERRRQAYTPDEVRARLHTRLAEAQSPADPGRVPTPEARSDDASAPARASVDRWWPSPAVRRAMGVLDRLRRRLGGAVPRTPPDVLPGGRSDA